MVINEYSGPGTKVRYIKIHMLLYIPQYVPSIVNRRESKVDFKIDDEHDTLYPRSYCLRIHVY